MDGVRSGNRIYWTLLQTIRDYTSQFHVTHVNQCPHSRLHCRCWVAASNFQWRTFPFLWVSQLTPCLHYSDQKHKFYLKTAHSRHFTFQTGLNSCSLGPHRKHRSQLLYHLSIALTAQRTSFLCCLERSLHQRLLFRESLLSSCWRIVVYLTVAAQQRARMS